MTDICPECGAAWPEIVTCESYFHQMLFWENEDPANGRVHHLAVLCYHLQHPTLYSPEGLEHGRKLLHWFIVDGLTPEQVRQQQKQKVASDNRAWTIRGSADKHGRYDFPIKWNMTAADVVAGGIENYCNNVEKWAASIQEQLATIDQARKFS